MWYFNGTGWRFISLASPVWTRTITITTSPPPPRQTIHEMPLAVDEYVARIRENCD